MNLRDQAQRFSIRADEYVQSVVERDAIDFHAPCPATQNRAGFIYRNGHTLFGQRNGSRHAGVAATDYRDALACIRHVL